MVFHDQAEPVALADASPLERGCKLASLCKDIGITHRLIRIIAVVECDDLKIRLLIKLSLYLERKVTGYKFTVHNDLLGYAVMFRMRD